MPEGSGCFPDEPPPSTGGRSSLLRGLRKRGGAGAGRPRVRTLLTAGAAVWTLYAASCFCPAYVSVGWGGPAGASPRHEVPGWRVLMIGWLPPATIAWTANIWLQLGWVAYLRGKSEAAAWYAATAAAVGLWALTLLGSEVERLLLGYYLWQASLVLFAAITFYHWRFNGALTVAVGCAEIPGGASVDSARKGGCHDGR